MATTYIGQARSNLDKKAGDSSGKEVCVTKFTYSSSSSSFYNWTYVFRPKKNALIMADMCEKACANNNIGYCSNGTKTYGKNAMQYLAKAVNYDLSKIKTKSGLSCGDLICLCSHYAGLSTFYIGSGKELAAAMSKNPNYTKYKYKSGFPLVRGDVLITAHSSGKNNHVVMFLGTSAELSHGKLSTSSSTSSASANPSSPTSASVSAKDSSAYLSYKGYPGEFPNLITHSGQRIGYTAISLAYPLGTKSSTYKYPNGKPTAAFKKAIDAVFPNRKWSAQCRAGASCDVGSATVIRYSGYDKKIPRGLDGQFPWLKKHTELWTKTSISKTSKAAMGDVGVYSNKGSGAHIWICLGGKLIGESNHTAKYFFHLMSKTYKDSSSRKMWGIYRANKPSAIIKGDKGTEVVKLQKFLNWYGCKCSTSGTVDDTTVNAIKQFQKKQGLTVNGIWGYGVVGSQITGTAGLVNNTSSQGQMTLGEDTGGPLVLTNEIAQLYSSDNFEWVTEEQEESEIEKAIKEKQASIKEYLSNINISDELQKNAAPLDVLVSYDTLKAQKEIKFKLDTLKDSSATQNLLSYPNLVEAPSIELTFNGIIIGGYNNSGDKYPNYISSMTVSKINGRINRYSISLVYQIRPGEDPNFIDKLLSRTGYTKPLKIKYGDCNSPGLVYKEESAVITDVKSQDNVSGLSITYNIQAISSITTADKSYFTFNTITGKPSTIINDLLYNSGQISTQLLTAFPQMQNKSFVSSNNLIPNNDSIVTVGGMTDVSPITYLTHVVSCMESVNNVASYFLSFNDSANGAYFRISEICPVMNSDVLYEIDVGYPGNNFVTNFQLCDNMYWPLVYDYNGSIPKWDYNIDNQGNIIKVGSNSLYSDNKFLLENIINKNWWKSLTEFPISAKVTLKGLTVPVMLMTYIRINTLFYGQKDIASGIYVVTDQEDSISGSGYNTTLTLLRVSD